MKEQHENQGQFSLLGKRRFGPFFLTQLFGAFNDNFFKNAIILFIAYKAGSSMSAHADMAINFAAGLLILPFFLFSALAGQIADKLEKSRLIQIIKLAEIILMLMAAFALYYENFVLLLMLLFLMGTQSTFFGPVKYSIIPQHLKKSEVVGGNALVEMGTFFAILAGTIVCGFLSQVHNGMLWIGCLICLVALLGWAASLFIPGGEADAPNLKINWNPVSETRKIMSVARKDRSVFLSIMGISWFWLFGAAFLTQVPNFTKIVLSSSESVVTLLLAMFSIGIGAGSLLCGKLSGKSVELALVPLGSIGLSIFGIDLACGYTAPHSMEIMGVTAFINSAGSIRLLVDFIMIGIFGGLYIVPLYTLLQTRTESRVRARIIAANNIMNALFMVLASVLAIILVGVIGLSIPHFFLIIAIANIAVAAYIYSLVPEFVLRFLFWVITHTFYRFRSDSLKQVPESGPAVLVCNHITFLDAFFIAASVRRVPRFVMDKMYINMPVASYIFRTTRVIPIASVKKDPETYNKAFDEISESLGNGELVCIFPEGRLTSDGDIDTFRPGIMKILKRNPVPVIPLALRGLWGSYFSRKYGSAMNGFPKRFWSRIELVSGKPIKPGKVTPDLLRNVVSRLRGNFA